MKKIRYYLLALVCVGALFQACQQTPEFPDPGFDFTSDKNVEIRRDTADFYEISMRMNVPNGVEKIEVLNGYTYKLIEDISDYKGQKDFDFKYKIDFSSVNADTTLNYVIKVIDQSSRSFNRGVSIRLKKFSVPEIIISGGDRVGISSPVFFVKARITAGMNTIKSIVITYEGKEIKRIDSGIQAKDTVINEKVFLGQLEWDREYHLNIAVTDSKAQEAVKTMVLLRKDLQKPKSIDYYDGGTFWGTYHLKYDDKNRLSGISWDYVKISRTYEYTLSYNEQGMVKEILNVTYVERDLCTKYTYSRFFYKDNTTRLDYETYQEVWHYDAGAIVTKAENKTVENIVYNTNGTIKSVVSGANTIDNISYSPGFTEEEWIFSEYWYTSFSGIRDQYRQARTDFQPVFMPTYVEGLPPFPSESGYTKDLFCDLFYHPYIFDKNVRLTNPSYDRTHTYSYTTDSEGRIEKIIVSYTDYTGKRFIKEYRFSY